MSPGRAIAPAAPRVPPPALWLGAAGLLPFLGLALAVLFAGPGLAAWSVTALLGYGATILAFLGGIQWGLAIADASAPRLALRLGVSVLPSLLGWLALLLPARSGLLLLAAGIGAMLWVDLRLTAAGGAPAWYPRLRLPLSAGAAAALLLAALLR